MFLQLNQTTAFGVISLHLKNGVLFSLIALRRQLCSDVRLFIFTIYVPFDRLEVTDCAVDGPLKSKNRIN